MMRRRAERRGKLAPEELQDICHKVCCEHEYMHDVAKQYRTTQPNISNIIARAIKDPDFFERSK